MKVADYEKAIEDFPADITIDEMILSKGQVKAVYAHSHRVYLKWDSFGRGFSCHIDNMPGGNERLDHLPIDKVIDVRKIVSDWGRDVVYDLEMVALPRPARHR